MKIAIDATPLLSDSKSGIGCYQSEMINAMLKYGPPDDELILQYFDPKAGNPKSRFLTEYISDNVSANCCRWFSARIYKRLSSFIPVPYTFFFKDKPNASLFFNFYLPPSARGRKLLFVHDMVIKDLPETMDAKTRKLMELTLESSIGRADRIITISEFSKKQIVKHFGFDKSRITVVPCAADRDKFRVIDDKVAIKAVKRRYGVNGRYFLYLGTLEPRKNIVRLVEAYQSAKAKKPDMPKLVLTGGKGWQYDEIFSKVSASEYKDDIIFTGYVDNDDVPILMTAAEAFCFPSLYEGFGMPPLEAMACGTPPIVSNVSSLPEVVGDCGISVDPYSVEKIANALISASEEDFKDSQKKKCQERADMFSWEKSVKILYDVLNSPD